jgi:hypothetical protein
MKYFSKYVIFLELSLINSQNLLQNSWISVFSVAKIEYVTIISNWMHEIMAGQKKKPSYLSESPRFPEYYIGWIVIGNCGQKTSNTYQLTYIPITLFWCHLFKEEKIK